jgi:hypothetical protein
VRVRGAASPKGKPGPMVTAPKVAPSSGGAFADALKGKFPGR